MRYYTPETANRTLPLVRRIAADLVGLQFEVNVRGDQINALAERGEGLRTTSAHDEELADMKVSLQADRDRMSEIEEELGRLGVILHSPVSGAVDFPARLNAVDVRLCWQPGEDAVMHWHLPDEPVHRRRSIDGLQFDPPPVSREDDSDNGSQAGSHPSLRS